MNASVTAKDAVSADAAAIQRIVLLGASNLTLGFPLVVEQLRALHSGPLEVFAAHGHGRSYGRWSRVLIRELPGITESGLWQALEESVDSSDATISALVTDVGNDLLYLGDVEPVAAWVETCLKRLREHNAEIVLTLPPLASIERLPEWRYYLMRSVLFPGCRVAAPKMRQLAVELDQALRELGNQYDAALITPQAEWYGFDPIHIRRSLRKEAWREMLSAWSEVGESTGSAAVAARLPVPSVWSMRPAERRLFGQSSTQGQPSWQHDDILISVY